MRAKIIAFAQEPMKQEFTMKITMSLEDWKNLYNQLATVKYEPFPSCHIKQGIGEMVNQAERTFTHEIEL